MMFLIGAAVAQERHAAPASYRRAKEAAKRRRQPRPHVPLPFNRRDAEETRSARAYARVIERASQGRAPAHAEGFVLRAGRPPVCNCRLGRPSAAEALLWVGHAASLRCCADS